MNPVFATAEEILSYAPSEAKEELGKSEEGQKIYGEKIGSGPIRISLIAGCHADEPLGPRFLSHFLSYLRDKQQRLGKDFTWWIVPNTNPDGETANKAWNRHKEFNLEAYLRYSQRDLPGKDLEFNFPHSLSDTSTRPESQAIYRWWSKDKTPFSLHASLHGMSFAFGPWFLIDKRWATQSQTLQKKCREASSELGYQLHDGQRHGEKGFTRIAEGFATTPSKKAMCEHFLKQGDKETAGRFHFNSMDCIQNFNQVVSNSKQEALCLVSEMPLFLLPPPGDKERTPEAMQESFDIWRAKISKAKEQLRENQQKITDNFLSKLQNIETMPPPHHMALQWEMIKAGISTLTER